MKRPVRSAISLALSLLLPLSSAAPAFAQFERAASAGSAASGIRPIASAPAALNPSLAARSASAASAAPVSAAAPAAAAASVSQAVLAAPAASLASPAAVAAAPAAASPAAPSNDPSLSPRSAQTLQGAWRTAKELVEPVPDAPNALADAPLTPEPGRAYQPSPEDWRDESFYFALLDRFARSGPGRPVGEPKDGNSRHGGNLRGVIEKLDYLKGAGVTTLMISPVTQTLPEAYHGYAPVHMMAVDPHLGTMDDMKELVREAHKRGLKVVLDWVLNHAGPVFEYKDGSKWTGMDRPAKEIGEWTQKLGPSDLAKPENFTRHGVIDNWDDHEQAINGDFPPNYRHYNSLNPETADRMIHIANWWIKETDIDGFRLDAVRHVPPAFLPVFVKRVRDYAATLGKNNFLFVGENSTGYEGDLKPYLGPNMLNSLFHYPAMRRDNKALHGAAPSWVLEDSLKASSDVLGNGAGMLMRFIDGHDVYRFLRVGEPLGVLHAALGYLMFSIGIPIGYYGTEQAFRQGTGRLEPEGPAFPADPFNREDMFAGGQFKSESSAGDKFDPTSPTYKHLAALNALRAKYPALRRGEQYVRWSDQNGAGIYAFSRIYNGQEVVVAMNFSPDARSASMWVDHGITPPGTALADALDPSYRVAARAEETGSKLDVEIPPFGVRVFVRPAELPAPALAVAPVPSVEAAAPSAARAPPETAAAPAPAAVPAPAPAAVQAPTPGRKLNILMAASESVPFIKTGGLADVVDAVSRGLAARGHKVTVALPLYKQTKTAGLELTPAGEVSVPMDGKTETAKLWTARREGVDIVFIDQPAFFHDDKGPYGGGSAYGVDANEKRWAFYARAVIEAAKTLDLKPDVVQAHDWHAALIPAYLSSVYGKDPYFAKTAAAVTIHNIAFQGQYDKTAAPLIGFTAGDAKRGGALEHQGGINYLKAGLVTADAVTTVSKTYAQEIQSGPEFGMGLEEILKRRAKDVTGIVNGVDPELWDPRTDALIARRYGADDVEAGKAANKADLQRRMGLEVNPDAPIFAVASRLSHQKGIDTVLSAVHSIAGKGGQLVISGAGDKELEDRVAELVKFYGYYGRVAFHTFSETFVHSVYAAADFLMMPSRFEPCGLSQLIAHRFGTLPIVARTGGLADTVRELRDDPERGDGLFVLPAQDGGIWETVNDAFAGFRNPAALAAARRTAMAKDSSWGPSLDEYEALFRRIAKP